MLGTANNNIRLNPHALQFFHTGLCRFGFHFSGGADIGNEGYMNQDGVLIYERFIDENLGKNSNVTTGKVYWSVLQKERRGDYGGGTVHQ